MDYSSNSSSEQLSSNALNERIANGIDSIESQMKVYIEKNNKIDEKDSKYPLILSKQKAKTDNNIRKMSEFEYKTDDNIDLKIERNLLNFHNISEENNYEMKKVGENSFEMSNKDIFNNSFIDWDNIEIEKLFFDESKTQLKSNKSRIYGKEISKNNSLIKTTTTAPDFNDVSKNEISLRDKNLKNSKPKLSGNIYKNKVIITVETSDSSPTTSMTTNTTNRSNSLIDRIKYLSEKEGNKKRVKQNYLNTDGCCNEYDQFVASIRQTVSGDYLTISFQSKPATCEERLCLFLSCESNTTNKCEKDWESLCKTPQNCNNITQSECKLKLRNNNNNCEVNKYINIYYNCVNRNESSKCCKCTTIQIQFNSEKPDSDNRLPVIITATVVPIVICVAIFAFLCFKRNKNMKKFDW